MCCERCLLQRANELRAKSTISKTAKILSAKREAYVENAEECKIEANASYQANPNRKKAASKAHYSFDPERRVLLKHDIALTRKERRLHPKHNIALTQKQKLPLNHAIALT